MQVGLNRDVENFADRVKNRRVELGLKQGQVAKLAGLRQPDVSKIELGRINETTKLLGLARALQCDPDWLATGKGKVERQQQQPTYITYVPPTIGIGASELKESDHYNQPQKISMALGVIEKALTQLDMHGRERLAKMFESFARSPGPIMKEDIAMLLASAAKKSEALEEASLQKTG